MLFTIPCSNLLESCGLKPTECCETQGGLNWYHGTMTNKTWDIQRNLCYTICFLEKKTGPGGFVQADVLYMCLFPSYFRFIFPNTPGPPSHPLPVASSLQVGGGEPRGRSERHIGHHVSLGCGSIGFFWGRCYAFIGGKRLGDWWHADVDLDVCFFLGFLWAMRINTLLMI